MSEQVVVVGAGGHAKVCIELLKASGMSPAVCVGSEGDPDTCLGITILKGDWHLRGLRERGLKSAFVAIGDNGLRERLASSLTQLGFQFASAISPAAILSPSAEIGKGVAIMAGVVINACVRIGDFSIINTGTTIDHDCNIGRATHLAPGCTLAGGVNVGDSSFLGVGTCVIPNLNIGRSTRIGAGSVVIRDIADNALAIGIPARQRRVAEEKLNKRIMVAQPVLGGNERKYVLDCLDTNWISSNGKYISEFEKRFAEFCGVEHAISTNNGTTALHLSLVGLGLQPGDEVLVPTVTYIATANAVQYCGAKPVLVDVCEGTLNIDVEAAALKVTSRTKGIIPVHLYGHPADMRAVMDFAKARNLWVVEDAAEAHGAKAHERMVGSIGTCATFSFFGNKIVTTGEGGMITTNDVELAKKLRLFRGQGMDMERRYWFPVVGYNYRMTNIQAAIGLAQMDNIDKALLDRAQIAEWYNAALAGLQNSILLPKQAPWAKQVFWMYNILLRNGDAARRDRVMLAMDKLGIETRPVFYPMHSMPPYFETNAYPVADTWSPRGINLPTHQALTKSDIERVAAALHVALQD